MTHWRPFHRFRSILLVLDLVHVTAVEPLPDHRLKLAFDDGTSGEVDLSDWPWGGVFEPLRDPDFFQQVALDEELGTIVWPNGADIAPETLHTWVLSGQIVTRRSSAR